MKSIITKFNSGSDTFQYLTNHNINKSTGSRTNKKQEQNLQIQHVIQTKTVIAATFREDILKSDVCDV